jgi:hypothetical protein
LFAFHFFDSLYYFLNGQNLGLWPIFKKKICLASIPERVLAMDVTSAGYFTAFINEALCTWKQSYLAKSSEQSLFTKQHFERRIF